MINVSAQFRSLMAQRTDFKCHAQVTLTDGTVLSWAEKDFCLSGNTVTDGAGADCFPLGATVCRTIRLEVMNDDGHLDEYDFFGAKIRLWLSYTLSETTERIEFGTFTVTEPETWGETVIITAGDDMYKANRPYETTLIFPATLGSMLRDICETCDIPYATSSFPNDGFLVESAPAGDYTCRQVLGYIAMIAGGNARIGRAGRMEILTYDPARTADHELADWAELNVATDDILITGVETVVTSADEEGNTVETTVLEGAEGYVLTVENPLIAGKEAKALSLMGQKLIGAVFRKFEGRHIAYPLVEFMDMVTVTDRKGNTYRSVVTDMTFAFGGFTELSNSAASAVRNSSKFLSPEVKARLAARALVERERTSRELAMEALSRQLAESGGLYSTEETLEDGSTIYYLHDKPTIGESKNVMKLTAEAIGLSVDGGRTYPFGFTVTGEMVMSIIQAEGLNADWINVGTLAQDRVEGLDELASSFQVMAERIESKVWKTDIQETYADTLTDTTPEYYLSTSPEAPKGGSWSKTAPAWEEGKYLWTRSVVTYGDGSTAYAPSAAGVCITGNTGGKGTDGKDGAQGGQGLNLIRGTNAVTALTSTGKWENGTWRAASGGSGTRKFIEVTDAPNPEIKTGWSLSQTSGAVDVAQDAVPVQNGVTYTMSCYARGTGELRMQYGKSPYRSRTVTLPGVDTWTRYSYTFTVGAASDGSADGSTNIYFGNNAVGTLEICGMKLEQGSIPAEETVWVPAIEDLVGPQGEQGIQGPKGDTGATGATGATGNGIASVTAEYYLSTSETSATGGSWGTAVPTITEGTYLWTRNKITYTDGTTEYTGAYCLSKAMAESVNVGGRNLVLASDVEKTGVSGTASKMGPSWYLSDYGKEVLAAPGTELVISYDAKSTVAGQRISMNLRPDEPNAHATPWNQYATLTEEYQRFSFKTAIQNGMENLADRAWVLMLAYPGDTAATVSVQNVKVELGNVATDWTPAPEDMQNALDATTVSTIQQVTEMIQDNQSIILSAMEDYVRTSDHETFRQQLTAQLAVLADQVSIEIIRAAEELHTADEQLQARYEQITKYYRFTEDGLLIGDSTSDLTLRLNNGRLSFLDRGAEVAYISDRTMYITDGTFLNSLRIGNFAFVPRDNGNLSFVRMD